MFPIFAGNSASTGYNLTRSLRFRSSATPSLSRTFAAGNQKTWTWSGWVKRGTIGVTQAIFDTGVLTSSDSTLAILGFNADAINFSAYSFSYRTTTQVFRDPAAWYHIVLNLDTTQATAANRVKLYVNGTQVTAFASSTDPTLNANYAINQAAPHYFGYPSYSYGHFDGYLAEVNFIDGQALTPSSFGSTNALTGVWQPAAYTGTYGTNGFYLPFTDNSALTTASNVGLGKDFSGNGNYWTTNNISITAGVTYDSMTDVPTLTSATAANFCVVNPLSAQGLSVPINGNLTVQTTNAEVGFYLGTISASIAYYFELTLGAGGGVPIIGVVTPDKVNFYFYYEAYNGDVWTDITLLGNVGVASTGDVIGFAVNGSGSNNFVLYKNGVSVFSTTLSAKDVTPVIYDVTGGSGIIVNLNCGQRPFTYTAPSGFVALNTYNLPTSTIVKGNTVMDATLYTGTLLSNAVTNAASFKPDLVWIKSRSAATSHKLTDSVRGVTIGLVSNTTAAETTDTQGLTAFGSAGFTVGTNTDYNNLAATYVGWQWQAGQGSTSSNTNGTITSTVSVNASAGFSVVTYTGNSTDNTNYTVGHGLGVKPGLVIIKNRDWAASTGAWAVWHQSQATSLGFLNTTGAFDANDFDYFLGDVEPTSSVFTIRSDTAVSAANRYRTNGGGSYKYVAYCWTPIAGFSAFGSYTGNGSADGPFVYTGFKPRYVMFKRTDSAASWIIRDTARDPYNVSLTSLYANLSDADDTSGGSAYGVDILSNGFKLRGSGGGLNASGGTFIYAAFSSNPFKNSLAQ